MKTTTAQLVFDKNNVPPVVDFLSMDVEGAEFKILQGISHDKHCFRTIAIEHNHVEPERSNIRSFLENKEYEYEGSDKFDDFYTKNCKPNDI